MAAIALVAIEALYLSIVNSQGGAQSDQPLVVPFVAGYLGMSAVALVASLVTPPAIKAALRSGASAGLLVLGVLAAFSIGVAVLVAAALAIFATALTVGRNPTTRAVGGAFAGAIVAVGLLAAGFWIAWSNIQCPSSGESGGSTATGITYSCENGILTTKP